MIVEAGLVALILALFAAALQGVLSLVGARHGAASWMAAGRGAAMAQAGLLTGAIAALAYAFLTSDFSLLTVAEGSHSAKPMLYKLAGTWAGRAGSLLLWTTLLSVYGLLFALAVRLPAATRARAIGVLGLVGAALISYLLFAGHPFVRLIPAPLEGAGLNPLLQDPALAYHPPLLYLGYVGLAPPFALAAASLIEGRMTAQTAAAIRRLALAAWAFLTLGIGLGAWWSYETLGWGGWWAWDPVENASLMPWLVACGLFHLAGRGWAGAWTAFLALCGFVLTLLGTFLARTGVLASVHAFATDAGAGLLVLSVLVAVAGWAFLLFALRAGRLGMGESSASDIPALFASILMGVAAATVMLGTLYPLVLEAVGGGRISVGPPYYDLMFSAFAVPMALLMVWARGRTLASLLGPLALGAMVGLAVCLPGGFGWPAVLAGLAAMLAVACLCRQGLGMRLGHLGVALLMAGAAAGPWQQMTDATLRPGDSVSLAGQTWRLDRLEDARGPDYEALRAVLTRADGVHLTPEVRRYAPPADKAVPDTRPGPLVDVQAVLTGQEENGAVALRLMVRPLQSWIFAGMVLMVLGGLAGLRSRRPDDLPVVRPGRSGPGRFLPLIAVIGLAAVFAWRLVPSAPKVDATDPASGPPVSTAAMIGKPMPVFDLPALSGTGLRQTSAGLEGKAVVINIFASWCAPCRAEAPALRTLAAAGVPLIGIAYKDDPAKVRVFLSELGNPYAGIGVDAGGTAAIGFGITGVPETFVVDKTGIIRFKYAGPLTDDVVRTRILPLLKGAP